MKVSVGAGTDVGRVRGGNEDSYLVVEPLFGVADGMGGHLAGDVASSTAVEIIQQQMERDGGPRPGALARYIEEANRVIWQRANEDSSLRGMGTTCTILLIEDGVGHLAHVGDSRAYLLRENHLEQLTDDHTLVNRMVKEGRLQPEEAHHHPQRSIITRALGVDEEVEVDTYEISLNEGDRLLLCSDGLTSMLEERAIQHILGEEDRSQTAAEALIQAANDAGGEDNITVVVVDVVDAAPGAAPAGGPSHERAGVAPPAAEPLPQHEEEPRPERASHLEAVQHEEESGRGWGWRALGITVVVLILVAAGAFGAARYTLANAWFVGTTDDGVLAIYKGVPEAVLGFELKELEMEGTVEVEDLPEFLRDDVEQGIKVESLDHAQRTMSNLEERSRDFGVTQDRERQRDRDE